MIAVRQPQDALAPTSTSDFHRQVLCLLGRRKGEPGQARLALQVLRRHLQGGVAFPKVRTVASASAFSRAIKSGVCVVDFYTRWFPMTTQRLLELEVIVKTLSPKATLVMVDLDAVPHLTIQLSVVVLPTLLVYANGQLRGRCVGTHTRRQIGGLLTAITSNSSSGEFALG